MAFAFFIFYLSCQIFCVHMNFLTILCFLTWQYWFFLPWQICHISLVDEICVYKPLPLLKNSDGNFSAIFQSWWHFLVAEQNLGFYLSKKENKIWAFSFNLLSVGFLFYFHMEKGLVWSRRVGLWVQLDKRIRAGNRSLVLNKSCGRMLLLPHVWAISWSHHTRCVGGCCSHHTCGRYQHPFFRIVAILLGKKWL